jgi:hypothetical protein
MVTGNAGELKTGDRRREARHGEGRALQEPCLMSRRAFEPPRSPRAQRRRWRRVGGGQRGHRAQVAELAGEGGEKQIADLTERRPGADDELPRLPWFVGI